MKQLTKEEILAKHSGYHVDVLKMIHSAETKEDEFFGTSLKPSEALNAMDEFAEQGSIAFGVWLFKNKIKAVRGKDGLFYPLGCGEDDVHYTLMELYSIFKHQNKQQ